ncbi:MAG: DUF58 domain-containing protein [Acidimicrobiia bacterium]
MSPLVAGILLVLAGITFALGRGPVGPTGRAALVLALMAALAIVLPPWVSIAAAVLLAALVVVDAALGRTKAQVQANVPRLLARAVPAELSVSVPTRHGATPVIRQAPVPDVRVDPSVSHGRLRGTITALRRGRHVLPGAAARVEGPLGLAAWRAQPSDDHELTVFPDLPAARRIAAAVRKDRVVSAGIRIKGPIGLGTEFDAIRDYQPDDDIRTVNWRATARVGRPMVNRYRVEQDRDIICLVDCGRLMGAPVSGPGGVRTRLDAALDAVAAMAMVADAVGDRVGVVAFDNEIRRSLRPHRAGSDGVVHAIYDLEPSLHDSDFELAFRNVTSMKRGLVMLFTDVVDEGAARLILSALPILAAKHMVVVASLRDDDIQRIAHTVPCDAKAAYRMAAALDVLSERDLLMKQLQQRGAETVTETLTRFSPACVRAYLFAKQRAKI